MKSDIKVIETKKEYDAALKKFQAIFKYRKDPNPIPNPFYHDISCFTMKLMTLKNKILKFLSLSKS